MENAYCTYCTGGVQVSLDENTKSHTFLGSRYTYKEIAVNRTQDYFRTLPFLILDIIIFQSVAHH